MAATGITTISDLPDEVLSNIIAAVSNVRSRNSAALVCRKWYILERCTRTAITLRGNLRSLFMVPTCFPSISALDISLLSPWGHHISSTHLLHHAFPSLSSITIYARDLSTIHLASSKWQNVKHVKLVRWHLRPSIEIGDVLKILFSECPRLESVDLSSFDYLADGLHPALESYPSVTSNLTGLNLLNGSFLDGFKSDDIMIITKLCPNLREFKVVCMFDPQYVGFVGDDALVSISANCPKLGILHLVDPWVWFEERIHPDEDVLVEHDAAINVTTLMELFSGLPLLEELVLDLCNNVCDSGAALEVLRWKCPKLRSLKLRHFQGISESKLDGVALCQWLKSLVIRNVGDLSDTGLIGIGKGCCRLSKLEVHGCREITVTGLRTVASSLRNTLVDVSISCCRNLNALQCLKALEPIQDRIERLHIDCIWDREDEWSCRWEKLHYLSLWIPVGQLLTPLVSKGLRSCPNLEEIFIEVAGNCSGLPGLSEHEEFGVCILGNYPKLWKMHLHCGEISSGARQVEVDLSLWEQFYLRGIHDLRLRELDYWPPANSNYSNQRSLSLEAAELLQKCAGLRKLFIHGTAHHHFMTLLLRIPNLRDVQLRQEYYSSAPQTQNDEMEADSCCSFEAALNRRHISD